MGLDIEISELTDLEVKVSFLIKHCKEMFAVFLLVSWVSVIYLMSQTSRLSLCLITHWFWNNDWVICKCVSGEMATEWEIWTANAWYFVVELYWFIHLCHYLRHCLLWSLCQFWEFIFRDFCLWCFFSVSLTFGISWVATTSTNGLKYNFNCLSNQLSNITTFKIPSLKLASLFCLENFFWGRMVDREWLCFILWWW